MPSRLRRSVMSTGCTASKRTCAAPRPCNFKTCSFTNNNDPPCEGHYLVAGARCEPPRAACLIRVFTLSVGIQMRNAFHSGVTPVTCFEYVLVVTSDIVANTSAIGFRIRRAPLRLRGRIIDTALIRMLSRFFLLKTCVLIFLPGLPLMRSANVCKTLRLATILQIQLLVARTIEIGGIARPSVA